MENSNRKIAFRAWNKERKIMGKSFTLEDMSYDFDDGFFIPGEDGVDPTRNSIVRQFTGLLDKQGKEIFEGDILECRMNDFIWRSTMEMGWAKTDQNEYGWHWKDKGPVRPQDRVSERMEIIGNIYENPELLK